MFDSSRTTTAAPPGIARELSTPQGRIAALGAESQKASRDALRATTHALIAPPAPLAATAEEAAAKVLGLQARTFAELTEAYRAGGAARPLALGKVETATGAVASFNGPRGVNLDARLARQLVRTGEKHFVDAATLLAPAAQARLQRSSAALTGAADALDRVTAATPGTLPKDEALRIMTRSASAEAREFAQSVAKLQTPGAATAARSGVAAKIAGIPTWGKIGMAIAGVALGAKLLMGRGKGAKTPANETASPPGGPGAGDATPVPSGAAPVLNGVPQAQQFTGQPDPAALDQAGYAPRAQPSMAAQAWQAGGQQGPSMAAQATLAINRPTSAMGPGRQVIGMPQEPVWRSAQAMSGPGSALEDQQQSLT